MRPALSLSLFLLLAAPPASAAAEPSERLIVEMALLHLVREVDIFANASFGPSVVYPQPGYRYWAVVGEAITSAGVWKSSPSTIASCSTAANPFSCQRCRG